MPSTNTSVGRQGWLVRQIDKVTAGWHNEWQATEHTHTHRRTHRHTHRHTHNTRALQVSLMPEGSTNCSTPQLHTGHIKSKHNDLWPTGEPQAHMRATGPQASLRPTGERQAHRRASGPQASHRPTGEHQAHRRAIIVNKQPWIVLTSPVLLHTLMPDSDITRSTGFVFVTFWKYTNTETLMRLYSVIRQNDHPRYAIRCSSGVTDRDKINAAQNPVKNDICVASVTSQ